MAILLSAEKVYQEYRSGEHICIAVNQLSFTIEKGSFLVIMGPSGSGKSTLLHVLTGNLPPTAGAVLYNEKNIYLLTDRQKAIYRGKDIGMVFQESNLLEDLNIRENIALPGYLYQKRAAAVARADRWMQCLDIYEERKQYPSQLSGGQKQRAALARGLMNNPRILFLDEPTGSLDSETSEKILDLLVKMNQKGQTLVMVTHDLNAAIRGDKVIVLKDGTICGTLEQGKYDKSNADKRKEKLYQMWNDRERVVL